MFILCFWSKTKGVACVVGNPLANSQIACRLKTDTGRLARGP
jgi:hypothetical protein